MVEPTTPTTRNTNNQDVPTTQLTPPVVTPNSPTSPYNAVALLFSGGAAGAVAKTFVAPFERAKLLLQVEGMRPEILSGRRSTGLLGTLARIFRNDGITGYWKGNFANIVRIFPNKAILFFSNDVFKSWIKRSNQQDLTALQRLVAGSMSGVTCVVATYPLDLVQTRLAGQDGGKVIYKGIIDCFRQTLRAEGPIGLYAGMGPTIAGIIPYAGISFSAYEVLKGFAPKQSNGQPSVFWKLFCGGWAGFIAQTVSFPIDTVRRRMQLQGSMNQRVYRHSIDCLLQILRQEGPLALFKGVSANLVRSGPNVAIQFTVFEIIKSYFDIEGSDSGS